MRLDFRAFRHLARGKFWAGLWTEINEDHCWGMAAELSYYFLLAFFPFLIFLSALIGLMPFEPDLLGRILNELNRFLPNRTKDQVSAVVTSFGGTESGSVLVVWIGVTLWAASLSFNGMAGVLNRAYRVRDRRSYFRVRSLSLLVTVGMSLFVILSGILLFYGDDFAKVTIDRIPFAEGSLLPAVLRLIYSTIRYSLIFLFLNLGIQMAYFAMPARRLPLSVLSPGSAFAAGGWLLGSLAFSFYVNNFANYQRMYGSLGDLIILMVWFYYSSLLLLVGGEMDSEIFRLRREERRKHSPERIPRRLEEQAIEPEEVRS